MLDILKSRFNGTIPAAVLDEFKATLATAMSEIEQKELVAFNYNYFVYVAVGAMPASMVNTAVEKFNKRQKRSAERKKKMGLIFNVVSLAISAVPVVRSLS